MDLTGQTILSILIPSIPGRKAMLDLLTGEIEKQIKECNEDLGGIEVVSDDGIEFLKGGLSIGMKRQKLLDQAIGKYVCFIDDDESIAPNYIDSMLRLCNEDKDVCTFRALMKLDSYWGIVDMRLLYKVNDQASPEYTIRRPPWHICPVRRELAQLYSFEDKSNAEDFQWFEKVLVHCATEAHTDKILFQYNHGIHSEADKIENSK